jgi:hypothetical protein
MPKRILLDNNVPRHLGRLLSPHQAAHASIMGWAGQTTNNQGRRPRLQRSQERDFEA